MRVGGKSWSHGSPPGLAWRQRGNGISRFSTTRRSVSNRSFGGMFTIHTIRRTRFVRGSAVSSICIFIQIFEFGRISNHCGIGKASKLLLAWRGTEKYGARRRKSTETTPESCDIRGKQERTAWMQDVFAN